jgi:hypothetical protein
MEHLCSNGNNSRRLCDKCNGSRYILVIKPRKCPHCIGIGSDNNMKCATCDGIGMIPLYSKVECNKCFNRGYLEF